MSNRPPLNWGSVLRDLKSDRAARPAVREEMLQRTPGLRGANSLSGWRGHSGKRYVVRVHGIDGFDTADAQGAVVLFIRRADDGIARIVLGGRDLDDRSIAGLLDLAKADGCREVHVHRLEDAPAGRAAILADLRAPAFEVA